MKLGMVPGLGLGRVGFSQLIPNQGRVLDVQNPARPSLIPYLYGAQETRKL